MVKLPRSAPRHSTLSAPRDAHGLRPGLDGLRDLMDRLLQPDGCPWDREQTLQTLRPFLIEEAHEVLDAMDDPAQHKGELGDVLFQIVFQAALREREGAFDLDDVVASIRDKLIRRHPHVFGGDEDRQVSTPEQVKAQWDRIKREERSGQSEVENPLRGVPRSMPALARAQRLQDKAASIGFDWKEIGGALDKLEEEVEELRQAQASGDAKHVRDEFGDLLFVLVRVGQKLGVDAEDALGLANKKFEERFKYMMQRCHDRGIDPASLGLEGLDALWDEAKAHEATTSG